MINAVIDAVSHLGVTDVGKPASPERVWRAIQDAQGRCGMIPAPFEYERAESVDHAIELLGTSDDAKLLAGGHSLLPLMKLRFAQPVAARRHRPASATCPTSARTATWSRSAR